MTTNETALGPPALVCLSSPDPSSPDEALVQAAAAGDVQAWADLVDLAAADVWAWALTRCGPEQAEAVSLTVWLRLAQALPLGLDRPLLLWLRRAVEQEARRLHGHRRNMHVLAPPAGAQQEPAGTVEEPPDARRQEDLAGVRRLARSPSGELPDRRVEDRPRPPQQERRRAHAHR